MILKAIKAIAARIGQFFPEENKVVYTQLAPADHSDMDFSEPPKLKRIPNASLRGVTVDYDWKGLVPDNSFKDVGILKNDIILFADVPITGYRPRLNSFVLIPPLEYSNINTGWGQLVQIKETSEDFIVASAYVDAVEVASRVSCSRIFGLAVGHHTAIDKRKHPPSMILAYPALTY